METIKNKPIKVTVFYEKDSAYLRVDDGGLASFHHNGDNMTTEYYQNRTLDKVVDWDKMSEGKMYYKDWESKQKLDDEMIKDALSWLVMPNHGNFEITYAVKKVALMFYFDYIIKDNKCGVFQETQDDRVHTKYICNTDKSRCDKLTDDDKFIYITL